MRNIRLEYLWESFQCLNSTLSEKCDKVAVSRVGQRWWMAMKKSKDGLEGKMTVLGTISDESKSDCCPCRKMSVFSSR